MGSENKFNSTFMHLFILTSSANRFERTSEEIKNIFFFKINLELSALAMKYLESSNSGFSDNTWEGTGIMDC